MFTIIDVRHPFLLWVSVEIRAEADMYLTAERLRFGGLGGAPVLDARVLQVKSGERFIINARKTDGFRIGDRVPLDRVANKRPIRAKWQTISTA